MDYEYTTKGPYGEIVDGTVKSGDNVVINSNLPNYALNIANQGSAQIVRPTGDIPKTGQSMTVDGNLTINLMTPTSIVSIVQGIASSGGNFSANVRIGKTGVLAVNGDGPTTRTAFGGSTLAGTVQNQGTIQITNTSLYGCKLSNFVSGIGSAANNPRGKLVLKDVTLQGGTQFPFNPNSQAATFTSISYQDISMEKSSIYISSIDNSTIYMSGSNNYVGFGAATAPGTASYVNNLTIRGFGAGDILDIPSAIYTDTWDYNGSTGILTIQSFSGALKEIKVDIGLGYDPSLFAIAPLPMGNSAAGETKSSGITYNGPTPCYLPGTLISTPSGAIPIECLTDGHEIYTYALGARKVDKIRKIARGKAFVNRDLVEQPDLAGYPVRIARGALGQEQPSADLFVTPEHSILIDGYLVPARMLVNNDTIHYDRTQECYEFYHIILEEHSIISANGILSETLYRAQTDSKPKGQDHGKTRPLAAPIIKQPSIAKAIYGKIASTEITRSTIDEGDQANFFDRLYLKGGDQIIRPLRKTGERVIFLIPATMNEVELRCPALRLCDAVGPYWDDRRLLGALIGDINLFDSREQVALNSHLTPWMRRGWNLFETDRARWTTGTTPITFPIREPDSVGILSLEILDDCFNAARLARMHEAA